MANRQKHAFGNPVPCIQCGLVVGATWASSRDSALNGYGLCDDCHVAALEGATAIQQLAAVDAGTPADEAPSDAAAPSKRRTKATAAAPADPGPAAAEAAPDGQ